MDILKNEITVSRHDSKWDMSDNEAAYQFWNDEIIMRRHDIGEGCRIRAVFKYRQLLRRTLMDRLNKRYPFVEHQFSTSDLLAVSIFEKGEEVAYQITEFSSVLLFVTANDEKNYYSIPSLQNKTHGVPCINIPGKGLTPYIEVACADIVELKFISRLFVDR